MIFNYHSQQIEYRKYIDRLMKQAQSPVAQASLAVVGALLFASFLAIAALRPTLITIASLARSIDDEKKTIKALDMKIQSLGIAQKKLDAIKNQLKPANVAIPDGISMEDFSKELEILAKEHGLVFLEIRQEGFPLFNKEITVPQLGQLPTVSKVSVHVVVGGTEDAIRAFIADLENLDRLTIVVATNFTKVKVEEQKERPYPLSVDISIDIFTTQKIGGGKKPISAVSSSGSTP